MAETIAFSMGDVGEGTKPVLERELGDYEAAYLLHCEKCDDARRVPLKGRFLNQIFVQEDCGRESVVLSLDIPRLVQCSHCDSVYCMNFPKPVYRRTFDIDEKLPLEGQIGFQYRGNQADLEEAIKSPDFKFSHTFVGIPVRVG